MIRQLVALLILLIYFLITLSINFISQTSIVVHLLILLLKDLTFLLLALFQLWLYGLIITNLNTKLGMALFFLLVTVFISRIWLLVLTFMSFFIEVFYLLKVSKISCISKALLWYNYSFKSVTEILSSILFREKIKIFYHAFVL